MLDQHIKSLLIRPCSISPSTLSTHTKRYVTKSDQSKWPTQHHATRQHTPDPVSGSRYHPILNLTQQDPTLHSFQVHSSTSFPQRIRRSESITILKMPLLLQPRTENGIMLWTPTTILLHALWSWQFALSCAAEVLLLMAIATSYQDLWGAKHEVPPAYGFPPSPLSSPTQSSSPSDM